MPDFSPLPAPLPTPLPTPRPAPAVRRLPSVRAPQPAHWQQGVFTAEQALAEGWTTRQVKRRKDSGAWVPVLGSGLRVRPEDEHAPATHLQCCWAAALTWPDRCISHLSAAHLLGWPVVPSAAVNLLAARGTHPAKGVVIRSAELPQSDRFRWAPEVTVTAPGRTALDCFSVLPFDDALNLYGWLTICRRYSHADLAAGVQARTGRHGVGRLVTLLQATASGAVSVGEIRLHRILRSARITGWVANAPIRVNGATIAVADVLFERERVILEFDGRRVHSTPEAFVTDRRRQNALHRAGYIVLRYTWDDVVNRPEHVIREVRAVLAQR